jgi:HEAT repeat protein
MHGRLFSLLPWAFCLLLLLSGCAETAHRVGSFVSRPFNRTPEEELGIRTPKDRVRELRKLAKGAAKQPTVEQDRVVGELAVEYQRESDAWVRREILRTLSAYPQPAAGAVLVAALGESDVETRRAACTGLGKRHDKTAVQELARVLASDTDVDVRMAAVEALGSSADQAALGPLAEALVDPDPAMQAQTQAALIEVSGRDFGNNVQAWREFAQTGKSGTAELSFAEKLRRAFY